MKIPIYQVDAFTSEVFKGNPAAVCPLNEWLPDEIMQKIAQENNLSETAFFINKNDTFDIRWFTPISELDLAGHPTLATAHVIINELKMTPLLVNYNCHYNTKIGIRNLAYLRSLIGADFMQCTVSPERVKKITKETVKGDDARQKQIEEAKKTQLSQEQKIKKSVKDKIILLFSGILNLFL